MAAHKAAAAGHAPVLQYLLDVAPETLRQPARNGDTPAHRAASNGHLASIRCLPQTVSLQLLVSLPRNIIIILSLSFSHCEMIMTDCDEIKGSKVVTLMLILRMIVCLPRTARLLHFFLVLCVYLDILAILTFNCLGVDQSSSGSFNYVLN